MTSRCTLYISRTEEKQQAVVPLMKRQRSGKIINISPIAGRGLSQSSSTYATAKGGVIAFTRKLSFELGRYGMTCNAIAPSRMRDDLGAIPFLGKGALREMRRPHILRVP